MNTRLLLVSLLVGHSALASAQPCPTQAPTGGTVWYEFQVEKVARYVGDAARLPYPDASLGTRPPFPSDFLLAQFVVDTTGRVESRTFKLLRTPAGVSADSVRQALARWQFTPATVRACRVPQLVQTPLRWK